MTTLTRAVHTGRPTAVMIDTMKRAILVLLGASACGGERTVVRSPPPPDPAAELDPRFVDVIRAATPAYLQWGRVDERPRAAPTDCAMPTGDPEGQASQVRISEAPDSPHDAKLYFLWASDRRGYLEHARPFAPGFTIVKESFTAEPVTPVANAAPPPAADYFRAPPPIRTLRTGDRSLQVGMPTGLYVMTKLGSDAAGTDDGWIYGTIANNGSVTSAGRVASCMGCHDSATHERLFGLK